MKEERTFFISSLRPLPSSMLFLEEGVGVEPTRVVKLRRFSGPLGVPDAQPSPVWRKSWDLNPHRLISPATLAGSCHTVRRDFHDLSLAGVTRVERAWSKVN